ncbi:hypothetical protein ABPG72_018912 [Tetrahymena utriculariae]
MQENISRFQIYKQCMVELLLKVGKLIPKNKKDLKIEADKIQENIKTLNDQRFVNANSNINFFRDLLDLKVPKITEIVLFYLENLIANQLIDGYSSYSTNKTYEDEILQMVIECIGIKEDNIHLSVVKILHTIVVSPIFTVYGGNLMYLAQALINIYSQSNNSKSASLQNVTLAALKSIVKIVFDRMEKLTDITQEQQEIFFFKRCITSNRAGELLFQDNCTSSNNLNQENKQNFESPRNSFQNLNSIHQARLSQHSSNRQQSETMEEEQFDPSKILNLSQQSQDDNSQNVLDSHLNNQIQFYCRQAVTNLVDNTVIYYEKKKQVGEDNQTNIIPLLCVPPIYQETSDVYTQTIQVSVENENNQVSGKYGWCFICRKTANFYCRETRVAICCAECKQTHIKQIEDIFQMQSNKMQIKKNQYLEDGIELFKILCNLSKRDGANLNSQMNPQSLRSKIISLEMLKVIIENTGIVFLSNFQQLVKEQLIHSVLLNSMSQDQKVVQLSLSILVYLFIDFRDNLKKELEMFTKEILLKMLESSNTIYHHRFYVLQVFSLIFKLPRVILEMFANYDCQLNSKNIAQNIVEQLAKISQGKYSKAEFSTLFQPGQEQNLRETALQSLVEIVKNLIPFTLLSEEYFSIGSPQIGRQVVDNNNPLYGSDKQIDKTSKSVSNLDEDEQKNATQITQIESLAREMALSPQKNGSSQNLGNTSQFNSVGGGTGISDSSFNQDMFNEDTVQEQRKRKIQIQKCIEKFNYKTKQGLNFAFSQKIIEKPVDINKKPSENEADQNDLAIWQRSVYQLSELLYSQRASLDRVQFGLFFGDECKYNQDVFYHFLSYYDMSNQNIVQSLRILFKVMYPPNTQEALDRILQQFGEKYIKDNPEVYRNAGVTYTLSYAIMMLQTNLYNPQIKEKEKFNIQKFVKLVSKIDEGADLPLEQVEFIFNSVKEQPLGFHDYEEYHIKQKEAINSDAVLKTKKFKEEQEKMLAQGKQIIQNDSNDEDSQKFIKVLNSNFTKELLDVIWSPLFATFSQGLEQTEDKSFIMKCLEGIKFCIMLLGRFQLNLQQETFVQCLTKNTGLLQDKPFSIKNILSICCMTEIASTSGNWLRRSWKSILDCLQRIDYQFLGEFDIKEQLPYQQQLQQLEIEKSNQKLILLSLENETIDKIFSSTSKFDSESIQDFIECLCQVCKQEINQPKPKIFSLLRISEVAEFNMDRVRYEWNIIWQTLSNLFQDVGTNENSQCVPLVIDQLKQLSMKFLKKTELSHYSFQKMFLQPFLYIFENINTSKHEIYELILSCLINITSINFDNLRSGWSVIISIVRLTINKKIDSLLLYTSQIIDQIFLKDRTLENLSEEIPQIVDILCKLINYKNQTISQNCISYLNKLIDYLVLHSKYIQNPFSQSQNLSDQKSDLRIQFEAKQQRAQDYEKMLQQLWMPCLLCLSRIFDDNRLQVQRQRIEVLFKLIESYSYLFTEDFWQELFSQLFIPYFENLSSYYADKMNQEQFIVLHMKDTVQISYDSLIEIFYQNFNKLSSCLNYLLNILQKSITRYQKTTSKIAAEQMQSLLLNIGEHLTSEQLDEVLKFLGIIFESSFPQELQNAYQTKDHLKMTYDDVIIKKLVTNMSQVDIQFKLEYQTIINKIIIWLICINCVKEYFSKFSSKFTYQQLEKTQTYLYNSYQFATDFNSKIVFRYTLFKNGFFSNQEFVSFIQQQSDSRSVLLLIWYENYLRELQENKLTGQQNKNCLKLFLDNAVIIISKFVEYSRSVSDGQDQRRRILIDQQSKLRIDDIKIQDFEKIIKDTNSKEKNEYILLLRNNISQIILPCLKLIKPIEYYESINQILDLLIDLSSYSFQRNLLTITCKSCQQCENCKSKSQDSFDIDLKIIIKNILQQITRYMPRYSPQQAQEKSERQIKQNNQQQGQQEQKKTHQGIENNQLNQQVRQELNEEQKEQQEIKIVEQIKENQNLEQSKTILQETEQNNNNNNNNNNQIQIKQKEKEGQTESSNSQVQQIQCEQHENIEEDHSSEILDQQDQQQSPQNKIEQILIKEADEEQTQNKNSSVQQQNQNLMQTENHQTIEEEDHFSEITDQQDQQKSPSNQIEQNITKQEEEEEQQQQSQKIEKQQSEQSSEEQIQFEEDEQEDQVVKSESKQQTDNFILNQNDNQVQQEQQDNIEMNKKDLNEDQIIIVENETMN